MLAAKLHLVSTWSQAAVLLSGEQTQEADDKDSVTKEANVCVWFAILQSMLYIALL